MNMKTMTRTTEWLRANVVMHNQQIQEINRSLEKLDDRQCADETAVRILSQARWTLSQERNDYNVELGLRINSFKKAAQEVA